MTNATIACTELAEKGANVDVLRQRVHFMRKAPAHAGKTQRHMVAAVIGTVFV